MPNSTFEIEFQNKIKLEIKFFCMSQISERKTSFSSQGQKPSGHALTALYIFMHVKSIGMIVEIEFIFVS
jgi:hypothetical protein